MMLTRSDIAQLSHLLGFLEAIEPDIFLDYDGCFLSHGETHQNWLMNVKHLREIINREA